MKRGFTLIELLVYMAIMGFIIVVAGRVFSDSTIMRVRSQNMLKSAELAGKVTSSLKEDISQMGAKVWGESTANAYTINVNDHVYWDASNGDYSSYELRKNNPSAKFDSLVFRKAEFDNTGAFLGVRQIAYWVSNDSLFRACSTENGTEDAPVCLRSGSKILIATNVKRFELTPSKPGTPNSADTLFAPYKVSDYQFAPRTATGSSNPNFNVRDINPTGFGSSEIEVSGFSAKNEAAGKNFNQIYLAMPGATWTNCIQMSFKKDDTYAVEFEMPYFRTGDDERDSSSAQMLPGKDHIAVGLRGTDGEPPDGSPSDVLFYPPQSWQAASATRYAEFAIKKDASACLAITFAFYSPNAYRGKLRFRNFRIYRKADESFHFPRGDYGTESITPASTLVQQKINAKAFELAMEFEFNGEKVNTYSKDSDGNIKGMVITTPNNGIIVQATGGSP